MTVADDAPFLGGKKVTDPAHRYAQTIALSDHAKPGCGLGAGRTRDLLTWHQTVRRLGCAI
jgi:hypothetical protein